MALIMQDRYLDADYLTIRLQEFEEVRKKQVWFRVVPSDRPKSRTMYIEFFVGEQRRTTLRISDHLIETTPYKQFIIELGKEMPKNKKEMFMRTVKNCINLSKEKSLERTLKVVDKYSNF